MGQNSAEALRLSSAVELKQEVAAALCRAERRVLSPLVINHDKDLILPPRESVRQKAQETDNSTLLTIPAHEQPTTIRLKISGSAPSAD